MLWLLLQVLLLASHNKGAAGAGCGGRGGSCQAAARASTGARRVELHVRVLAVATDERWHGKRLYGARHHRLLLLLPVVATSELRGMPVPCSRRSGCHISARSCTSLSTTVAVLLLLLALALLL